MRVISCRFLLLAVVVGSCATAASARRLEDWPYERLLKDSELVVIAQATAVQDSKDRSDENPWKEEFLGVNTTFRIKAALKGKPTGDEIKVLHFRLKKGVLIEDGPLLVSFRQKGINLELKNGPQLGLGTPEYMLFLTTRKDGRYEPVSGRVDPELSVRELFAPLPSELDENPKK